MQAGYTRYGQNIGNFGGTGVNDQERIQIKGKVLDVELKTTRKGLQAALIKFLKEGKEIEVFVWPEAWEAHKLELQSGKTLILEGIHDDDESKMFILNNVISNS